MGVSQLPVTTLLLVQSEQIRQELFQMWPGVDNAQRRAVQLVFEHTVLVAAGGLFFASLVGSTTRAWS